MTREETINKWIIPAIKNTWNEKKCNEILKALEQEPSSSENPNKWIPCSERLPEIHQDVILSLRSLDVEVGYRAETEPYFYCHGADGCYIDPKNVLAWMPLPPQYQPEIPTGAEGSEE